MSNTGSGNNNTAVGFEALSGTSAIVASGTGSYNTAIGAGALYSYSGNDASGHAALFLNTTGSYNVAVGYAAGYNQTTGSNNIYVGHRGVAGESGVTRIGTANMQTETYIAGIENRCSGSACCSPGREDRATPGTIDWHPGGPAQVAA
jgi:hypothetical protein